MKSASSIYQQQVIQNSLLPQKSSINKITIFLLVVVWIGFLFVLAQGV